VHGVDLPQTFGARAGAEDAWHSTKRRRIHPANFHNLFTTSVEHAGA
jgi:hypothetical protein